MCARQVLIFAYIVSFNVKVGKVDRDPPLRRCQDLPDAVLVGRVQFGERRGDDAAVGGVDPPSASILKNMHAFDISVFENVEHWTYFRTSAHPNAARIQSIIEAQLSEAKYNRSIFFRLQNTA